MFDIVTRGGAPDQRRNWPPRGEEVARRAFLRQNRLVRTKAERDDTDEAPLHEARVAQAWAAALADPIQLLSLRARRALISLTSRPFRRDRILLQSAADETMLLDLDGGTYFTLNEVGARVWELCDGERSVAGIAAVLADEYDAPVELIERDVLELVTELEAERLIAAG